VFRQLLDRTSAFRNVGTDLEGNIHDRQRLANVIKEYKVIALMHFAASSLVGESVSNPEKYYRNNVEGILSLLRARGEADCKALVFSSTERKCMCCR
jgi:UDP-glucose 4-epimerase